MFIDFTIVNSLTIRLFKALWGKMLWNELSTSVMENAGVVIATGSIGIISPALIQKRAAR